MRSIKCLNLIIWGYFCLVSINALDSDNKDCGRGILAKNFNHRHYQHYDRNIRTPKIISGSPTKEGQFPWQVSLELLHPSLGFLGHWCGGVLIHRSWILSAAHCVHNDLFNLPLPPLWSAVLGEHDRLIESGYEQRVPIEKIVLHKNYRNFLHDLVLMKLSIPADLRSNSQIRPICLPSTWDKNHDNAADQPSEIFAESFQPDDDLDPLEPALSEVSNDIGNLLRSIQSDSRRNRNITILSMKDLMQTKILNRFWKSRSRAPLARSLQKPKRRRNDKLMRVHGDSLSDEQLNEKKSDAEQSELLFIDCIATGWGKTNISGDLTDVLLKTSVPLQTNDVCKNAYGGFVKIHRGHLCAGKLNGKGGTCVGDSGGPLQCRLVKNGPWLLAGITSFGSGCAVPGFPDVYSRITFYMKWIQDTIAQQ